MNFRELIKRDPQSRLEWAGKMLDAMIYARVQQLVHDGPYCDFLRRFKTWCDESGIVAVDNGHDETLTFRLKSGQT